MNVPFRARSALASKETIYASIILGFLASEKPFVSKSRNFISFLSAKDLVNTGPSKPL